ncbi:ABC transporter ATP-binding protein [Bryobacter aggregatus]|uniref:ABC transporter ATP-binding protein n=1 Tax=Bryobacter aggregatus TaxID=360054 RepID=UPI0004E24A49|nr:ABC transporter ATP-binding protein [Bryobacter aggregatus]
MHSNSTAKAITIADLLRPHRTLLFFGVLAVVGEGVANLLDPWPLKIVLDGVIRSKMDAGWLNNWITSLVGTDPVGTLKIAVVATLGIATLGALCSYAERYITVSVGQGILHSLRRTLYSHIQRLSLSFHDQARTGDLISRATGDIDTIQGFVTSGFLGTIINLLTLFGIVGVMFYLNWRFTLIALSITPLLFLVVFSFTRRIRTATREARKKEGEIVSVIQEVLSSMRVVKAFAREDYEEKRLEEESLESIGIALQARGLKGMLVMLVEMIVAVGTALVLWFGAKLVLDGTLSAGSLVVFVFYLGKMYKPMQELSKMTDTYAKAAVAYQRINEVLEIDREVKDSPAARTMGPVRGEIRFENVSFSYEPGSPILKSLSFTIQPGQSAAFVGPTGAGKSTILSLIPRFYDPVSGVIKIDGVDLREYTQKSLRDQMSFVLQDNLLFHAPVWNNIAYGRPEASREEVICAAKEANAAEFIEKMPEGYDTMLGERGQTLSGGQRQRIGIARAIIRNTPILLLDEPSSALDAASEQVVFEALDRLMQGKTCIVIAHRLSTIRRADTIHVIEDGTIVESGSHDQLVAAGGVYAKLIAAQSPELPVLEPLAPTG